MANSISVRIPVTGAPIVTGGAVNPGGAVSFTNEAKAKATINFGNKTPLCTKGVVFDVAGKTTSVHTACSNYLATGTYPFTSRIGTAETQHATLVVLAAPDPIIFPEKKPIIFPEDWVALALGLGIGLLVGFLIGRRQPVRTTQQ